MEYFIFLYLFLFNISLFSSGVADASVFNQFYLFTYIFNNPSLGPTKGTERAKVLMKNDNVLSAWSLDTGLECKDTRLFNTLLLMPSMAIHIEPI